MSISPTVRALNFFVDVVDANMSGRPIPPVPPGGYIRAEDLTNHDVLHVMNAVLNTVLSSEQEKQYVSDQTHMRIYSVFNRALSLPLGEALRTTLRGTIEKYWTSTIKHIVPHLPFEQFLVRDPRKLGASTVRGLERGLICTMQERRVFHVILVYNFLEMCKCFFMLKAESLGAQWHVVENEYREMDWEKIPAMSPEELAICARLGQARHEGNLPQVLKGFLNEREALDAETNRILDIWQSFVLGQFIDAMQTCFHKEFLTVLGIRDWGGIRDGTEVVHKYTRRAVELVGENAGSIEYKLLCAHFANSEVECNTDPLFRLMKDHLRKLSLCALGIKPFVDENSALYRSGYALYTEALRYQKGYDASYPPLPPEKFDSFSIPAFRGPDDIISSLEDPILLSLLFEKRCEGDTKGFCEAVLRIACPQDEKFVTKGLEYLSLIRPEPRPSLKQALEEPESAPKPSAAADDSAQQLRIKKGVQHKTRSSGRSAKKDVRHKPQKSVTDEDVDAKITSRACISLALPSQALIPPSPQSLDAKPAAAEHSMHPEESELSLPSPMDDATPSKKKVEDEVEALGSAFRSLTIADKVAPLQQRIQPSDPASNQCGVVCAAAAQETVQCEVSPAPQQHLEARDTGYCLARRPILHERVKRWAGYLSGDLGLLSPDELSTVRNHSHPLFIARVIMANCEPAPFLSRSTGKMNQLFTCVGSMRLLTEGQSRMIGVFEECMDHETLYHHLFRPTRQRDVLALFKQSVDAFQDNDEQEFPKMTPDPSQEVRCELEVPAGLEIRPRRFSLMVIDHRAGIEYTLAFATPVQKLS